MLKILMTAVPLCSVAYPAYAREPEYMIIGVFVGGVIVVGLGIWIVARMLANLLEKDTYDFTVRIVQEDHKRDNDRR